MLGDRALADDGVNSLAEAALDLAAFPRGDVGVEEDVDLLECLSMGLREHEEDVDGHGKAENAEDDVGSPLNVGKGRGDEVRKRKIEDP